YDVRYVSAQACFQRRLSVPEKVVGQAKPRVDIFPVGRVLYLREVARWYENTRRQRLRWYVPVQGVVTQAEVECRSAQGPLILREYASGCRVLQVFERRRPDRDRTGVSIQKCIGYGVVDLVGVVVPAGASQVV